MLQIEFINQSNNIPEPLFEKAQTMHQRFLNSDIVKYLKEQNDLNVIEKIADIIRENFRSVVIFGAGGSNLTGRSLVGYQRNLSYQKNMATKIYFCDSPDPVNFQLLMDEIELEEAAFLFISKSGETLETIAQFSLIITFDINPKKQFFYITQENNNPLHKLYREFGGYFLDHPKEIGGRFSIFTAVALLPALIAGFDIVKFRQAALKAFDDQHIITSCCYNQLYYEAGYNIIAFLSYIEKFRQFGEWWRQIFAESMGKDSKGFTPLFSVCPSDQHSQLQLYLDGPKDKIFKLIYSNSSDGSKMADIQGEFLYLKGKSLSEILNAQSASIISTLKDSGNPLTLIKADANDEILMGEIVAFSIAEVIITAYLLGVNPYDQPAVEAGKIMAKSRLNAKNIL